MKNYITIDENNVVTGISQLKGEIENKNMYPVETYDPSVLGKVFDSNKNTFSEIETPERFNISLFVDDKKYNRHLLGVGNSVRIEARVENSNGEIQNVNDSFAVPVKRVGGEVARTIGLDFQEGVASKTISWPSSGEFEITENLINMHLPKDQHFKFDRLVFSIYE